MTIPLSEPDITELEIEAVIGVLRISRLSIGPKMLEFEESIARLVDIPYAIAVSSGTAGLHLCLRALGIGEGDEVILPSFTFIAVGNVILSERARPVFVDIDPVTLNLDPGKIESAITAKTRAIIAVHTFGRPADLDPILEIARKHRLPVIEDACEALGAQYHGRAVGGIGTLGVFGFYPNKPITTGEGGMVVTRDPGLAKQIRALRNHGRNPDDGWLEHRLSGYNYRLSEINCALGVAQMSRLPEILKLREAAAARYSMELRGNCDVTAPPLEIPHARQCWFVYVVRLSERITRAERDSICIQLNAAGIGCGRYFPPLHLQPLYATYAAGRDLSITERVASRTLALPFFNRLTGDQIVEVCRGLKDAIGTVVEGRNT